MKEGNPPAVHVTPNANRQKPSNTPSSTSRPAAGRDSSMNAASNEATGRSHEIYSLRSRAKSTATIEKSND